MVSAAWLGWTVRDKMLPRLLLLLGLAAAAHASLLRSHWWQPAVPIRGGDPGKPLFLTPFIEAGNVTGGQAEASVKPLAGAVRSYAGYLTVNKEHGSNMFFWFFPAERDPDKAPVVLWLQGGPGASSLFGLFSENGPYEAPGGGKLALRKYSWSKMYNLLYIDNPVGTGYSFTSKEEGYATNQTRVGRDLYQAMLQFFQLFPKLQGREFYITGESYAGKYIPSLGYAIHQNNPTANLKINLQGLFIGNGYCDPGNMMVYSDYLFQLGLIDSDGRDSFKEYEERIVSYVRQERWMDAFLELDVFLNGDMTPYPTLFKNLTGFDFYFNYLYTKDYDKSEGTQIIQHADVRRALHVGDAAWHAGSDVEMRLREDMTKSVSPWLGELLDHYRVMVYNGQLDIIVAYPLTDNFLRNLSWSGAEAFKKAPRKIWKVGDQIAGYAKTADRLTQVLVRDAGHMVPGDQPLWALDLLNRFVKNKPF